MSTLIRTETGKDARGNKYLTNVYQDFASITPNASATSYTLTQEDGLYTLTETYTEEIPDPSGGGGGQVFPDIWSLDVSTTTEPMESNSYFKNGMTGQEFGWWAAWKAGREPGPNTYPADGPNAGFPASSSNSVVQALYHRFNRGETDYLAPRCVVKHQKVYTVPPSLSGVGFAVTDITGNPFSFPTNVNFLETGATAVQEGSTFRVTLEWLVSKPNKWDALIYGP
jgi:hypothetical protein